jgi:uncharacterized membrane protein YbhN (UPF0104 family)
LQKTLSNYLKGITWIIAGLLFSVSAWYVIRYFQWRGIMGIFELFKPGYFFLGAGSIIPCYWAVRTLRWAVILKNLNIKIPFIDLYLFSSVMLSLTIFTPLQSGEMLKVELLKKYGMIERFPGYASFFVERIVDLGVVFALASFSLLFYGGTTIDNIGMIIIIIIFLIGFLLCALFLFDKYILKGKLTLFYQSIKQSFVNIKVFGKVLFLTLVGWCLTAFAWQMCLYSLSIDIGIFKSIALTSWMTLINILSFIPGAIGISEAGTAELLVHFGEKAISAQAGALIIRFYGLFVALLGSIHLIIWLFIRILRKR